MPELDPEYLQFQQQQYEMWKAQKEAKSAATATPTRRLWSKWADWIPANRDDWQVCLKQADLILDLEFEYNGQLVCIGDMPWDAVCVLMIDAWRDKLTTEKDRRFTKNKAAAPTLSGAYRNRLLNTLQSMFTWCVERSLISHNPVSKAGREDESEGAREGWWTDEEFERFIPKAHPYLQKMLRVAYRCGGMRSGEIRSLSKTRSVNWDARLITVRAYSTKTKRSKVIPVTDDCWPILLAQKDTSPSDLLFPNPRDPEGGRLSDSTLNSWVKQWRERTGFKVLGENVVFHSGRHAFGVNSVLKGGKLPHIMDVMGISEMKTARRYMRLAGDAIEPTRDVMNAKWAAPAPQPASADRRGPLRSAPPRATADTKSVP